MSTSDVKHPEWRKENSLTSPEDRDPARTYRTRQSAPPLTEQEVDEALKCNNNTDFLSKFNAVERRYADPVDPMQRIGLVSFVPAKGARPNKNGVYGFAKLRGNYATQTEANERSEFLIRNVDSYHQIYHSYVGRPFPLTTTSKYSKETDDIDIRKEIKESVSTEVKKKRDKEKREIEEIKQREEELLSESNREEPDTFENYITNRVKYAQLSWTYLETKKKLLDMEDKIKLVCKEIYTDDKSYPEYKEKYMSKYMKAREESGLKTDTAELETSFMQFLNRYADLPFDQNEYIVDLKIVEETKCSKNALVLAPKDSEESDNATPLVDLESLSQVPLVRESTSSL